MGLTRVSAMFKMRRVALQTTGRLVLATLMIQDITDEFRIISGLNSKQEI
jgi:hypothetical protein